MVIISLPTVQLVQQKNGMERVSFHAIFFHSSLSTAVLVILGYQTDE